MGVVSSITSLTAGVANADSPSLLHNSSATPALQAAMNVNPNPAQGGADITIAGGVALEAEEGPSGTLRDIAEARPAGQISVYVVRPGDTLGAIGKMFGVTPNTIMWANDLGPKGTIRPGDTLVILPVSGVLHTVVKGETLASIAKKYKADAADIVDFNNLTPDAPLAVGDTITIPDGVEPTVSSSGAPTSPLHGAGGPALSGYFTRPLAFYIKTQGLHGYNGIDLGAPVGTNVMASAGGTVIIALGNGGWNGGYGNYIVIQHPNGTQTLYAHLSKVYVARGQVVGQGESIGTVGKTGKATGPHLHFEIRGAANPF